MELKDKFILEQKLDFLHTFFIIISSINFLKSPHSTEESDLDSDAS